MNLIMRDALDCESLEIVRVPIAVGRCPVCGGCFDVTITGYDTGLDGSIEDDDDKHWEALSMPYVDWLPIQERITRWLNTNFVVEE